MFDVLSARAIIHMVKMEIYMCNHAVYMEKHSVFPNTLYIYRRTGRWNAAFENSKENFAQFDRVGPPQMECQKPYRWNALLSVLTFSRFADGMPSNLGKWHSILRP